MANDARKVSELGIAPGAYANDRLVILTNPSTSPAVQTVTVGNLVNNIANLLQSNTPVSFVPATNNNLNIGSGTKTWNTIYVNSIVANGSSGTAGQVLYSNGTTSYWGSVPSINLQSISSNFVPAVNNTYSLGNSTYQWQSLYVTSNTIFIGGTPLSIANGTLTVNGTPVSGGGSTTSIVDNNGSIVIVANSSGDGAGLSTIELIPDENVPYSDQKIVIDPTAPNHIHIRAGGQQDNSSAVLFLGGEKNHVRIEDNNGVSLYNEYSYDNYFYYSNADFVTASWFTDSGNHYIQLETSNNQLVTSFWDFTNDSRNELEVGYDNGSSSRIATYGGSASNLGGGVYKVQVIEAPPSDPLALETLSYRLFTTRYNDVQLTFNDFRVEVGDDIRMYSRDVFAFYNYSNNEPISIVTNNDDVSRTWSFHANGAIEFPDYTVQNTAFNFTANSSHWDGAAPTSLNEAIDRLAILLKTLNGGTGA